MAVSQPACYPAPSACLLGRLLGPLPLLLLAELLPHPLLLPLKPLLLCCLLGLSPAGHRSSSISRSVESVGRGWVFRRAAGRQARLFFSASGSPRHRPGSASGTAAHPPLLLLCPQLCPLLHLLPQCLLKLSLRQRTPLRLAGNDMNPVRPHAHRHVLAGTTWPGHCQQGPTSGTVRRCCLSERC